MKLDGKNEKRAICVIRPPVSGFVCNLMKRNENLVKDFCFVSGVYVCVHKYSLYICLRV